MRKLALLCALTLVANFATAAGHPDSSKWQDLFKADLSDADFPAGVWSVENGVLTATKDEAIWTKKEYENCIIDLEFKNDKDTNSGVFVYGSDTKHWITDSVEIQIADDHGKWSKSPRTWQCAAIFGRLAASKSVVKQPGEWNRMTITCKGPLITVVLNGELVTEMDMRKWTDGKKNPDGTDIPKWLSKPLCSLPTKGHIGFQGKHAGAPIYFRNMKIKPLDYAASPRKRWPSQRRSVMTSRERVLSAIEHRQPDRVPVDLGAHRSSGIMAIAYRKLRQYLGLPERPIRVYDVIQQLAIVDNDVLDRFGADAIELGRGFCHDDKFWKPWRLPDGSECLIPVWTDLRREGEDWVLYSPASRPIGVQKAGSLYFEQTHWPYLDAVPDDLSALQDAMPEVIWALPAPPGPNAGLAAGAKALRATTDRAINALFGGNLMEWGQFLCRNDMFFMLLAGEPEKAHALLDKLVEIHLAALEKFLGAVGPYIDVILFGDDLGMQTGPQVSPKMYHEFFYPRHRTLWQRAKQLAPHVKVQLHCCGGIRPLLDDLIEAGLDAINPVQITCEGMEPAALKRDFGSRICFWGGGCDTRHMLPKATPEEIRRHVLRMLEIWAPGGGFIFQQVHNIMADVPPQNIAAMYDAVAEFNRTRS